MGLDIYVGPLTRYYLGDWETVVQRHGRESGIPVTIIRKDSENNQSQPKLSAEEVLDIVVRWRAGLTAGLGSNMTDPLNWAESADGEYFTDKPAWDGYGSLALLAAYEEHPQLARPKVASTDFSSDPAWKASMSEDFSSRYASILTPELWLPCTFDFVFKAPDASGNEVWIGSSVALLEQLRALNAATVNGSREQLTEYCRENFERGDSFERASRFGLAMFLDLAEKSLLLGQPMKMDY